MSDWSRKKTLAHKLVCFLSPNPMSISVALKVLYKRFTLEKVNGKKIHCRSKFARWC